MISSCVATSRIQLLSVFLPFSIPSTRKLMNLSLFTRPSLLTYLQIAQKFPRLKIVLEHVSTKEGVEAVKKLNANVVATVTAHHIDVSTRYLPSCLVRVCDFLVNR